MRRMMSLAISLCAMGWWMLAQSPPARAREVTLEPHRGTGAVCAVVAVPAGSAYETSMTRGVSHLIEHMVFDGAERYSRVEMSTWMDDVGGFLNAFTRTETTVYFMLVPAPHAEKGIEILSQMLLHSLFPAEELDKERKVIIEEIRREADDPRASRDRSVERALYRGSSLGEPVTGYPSTIETMSRDEILRFYRMHYAPSRMRITLMGDFDVSEALGWIEDYFPEPAAREGAPGAPRGSRGDRPEAPAAAPAPGWRNEIEAIVDAGLEPGFDMLVPLPPVNDADFPTALLVSTMLGGPDSPLPAAFEMSGLPEPQLSVELHRGFSALRIHVDAPQGAKTTHSAGAPHAVEMPHGADAPHGAEMPHRADAPHGAMPPAASAAAPTNPRYGDIPAMFEALAAWRPAEATVAEARLSFSSGEMFDREIYHRYVMSRGEGMGLFGKRYIDALTSGVAKVSASDCARVLRRTFDHLAFNACVTKAEASLPAGGSSRAAPPVEVFPNGVTAAALARPGSPVAALHLLVVGRNCAEGQTPRGVAELLGTLMRTSRAGAELAKELDALGARVQFGDVPYVPFDDYLLNPAYSFVRLESPAAASDRATALLVHALVACDFTEEDVDAAKKTLAREVAMRSGSPMFMLKGAVFSELFGGHPFGASIFPMPPALAALTLDDVEGFAKRYLRGGDIIATFVSSREPSEALGSLRGVLAAFPPGSVEPCPPIPSLPKPRPTVIPTNKEGAYLADCWLVPASDLSRFAAVLVAAEALARRMQLELREKMGLAYSTDCAVSLVPGGAVVYAYLGTAAERLGEAERALEAEIKGLLERPPDAAETAIAANRLIGQRTRSELASINEAYSLGLDLFLGGTGAVRSMRDLVASVSPEDLADVIATSLSFDRSRRIELVPMGTSDQPRGDMPVKMPERSKGGMQERQPATMPGKPPVTR